MSTGVEAAGGCLWCRYLGRGRGVDGERRPVRARQLTGDAVM